MPDRDLDILVPRDPELEKDPRQRLEKREAERAARLEAVTERMRTLEAARPPAGYIQVRTADLPSRYAEQVEAARQKTDAPGDTIEAIERVTARMADARRRFAEMKEINAVLRRHKAEGEQAQADALVARGVDEALVLQLVECDGDGRQGFGDLGVYQRGIRNTEARLTVLLVQAGVVRSESEVYDPDGTVTINENTEADRMEIMFPAKPDRATRKRLREHGFRPSRTTEGLWESPVTDSARAAIADSFWKGSD